MVGGTILYALTSIFGYQMWKFQLPGGGSPGALAVSFFLQISLMKLILLVAERAELVVPGVLPFF